MATIKLASGATFTGTTSEVEDFAKKMGIPIDGKNDLFYYSKSKDEYLWIPSMATEHIRNAILVHYRGWLDELQKAAPKPFIDALVNGPASDPVLVRLMKEMVKR
jgi:hypothetical protein